MLKHAFAFVTLIIVSLNTFVFSASASTVFRESFEEESRNEGNWTFGRPIIWETLGGNPGRFLYTSDLVTFAPMASTSSPHSKFTGNYRENKVRAVSADLKTFWSEYPIQGWPISLVLWSNNGTPEDGDDDWFGFARGGEAPQPGQGWQTYRFEIPSDSANLPEGWTLLPNGSHAPRDLTWEKLISHVDTLSFYYGDPSMMQLLMGWKLGLDNPTIETD